jgi:hypothetical protein
MYMGLQSLYSVVVTDLFVVKFRLCSLHGVRLVLSSFQFVAGTNTRHTKHNNLKFCL